MIKKLAAISIVFVLLLNTCITAFAYKFPVPDWGALLKDKTNMVTTTDLELYTKGSGSHIPYYGEKFEPYRGVYLGMTCDYTDGFLPLSSYLTYIESMNQGDLYYPSNVMIPKANVITTVGWTVNSLGEVNYNSIRKTLDALAKYNKPMFIRFANEMNCSSLGDEPDKYVEIFRKVANMIHEYPNFAVVWSPNDLGALDRPFEYYYPGDEYVDWVGISCYMIKYFQGKKNTQYKDSVYFMTGDYAWATNKIKPIVDFMKKNNIKKPVMISEGGVSTNNKFGENNQSWADPRLRDMLYYIIMKYPQVKLINYFNVHRKNEVERFDITNYSYAANTFREAANSGAYIREYNVPPKFSFTPASVGETIKAENGFVKLYTLAHDPNNATPTVTYRVDSKWYHSSDKIPYTCNLKLAALTDGKHTITVSINGKSKNYVLYKNGGYIKFGGQPTVPNNQIRVIYDNYDIFFDQPPVTVNNRTMVPLRAIFEALGATVQWNDATQTVTSTRNGNTISVQIGNNVMTVNGNKKTLDVPPQLINGRTMVPVRAISEGLGFAISWDGNKNTVYIWK